MILAQLAASTVSLDPMVVAVLAGTVTPLLTGLITKFQAGSGIKVLVSLVLIAIATVVSYIQTNTTFEVKTVILLFATTLVMHVATYYGVWKPTGVSTKLAPDFGIGAADPQV